MLPALTWKVKTEDKVLYLTFDDGPHPVVTPWVMDQLEQYNAKATFFCVGENVSRHPETFSQIAAKGHAAGNHTYNHLNGWRTSNEAYFSNINKAAELIPGKLFRPPYGRISLSQIRALKHQYRIVMWDVLTRDYDPQLNTGEAFAECVRLAGRGSIVVFHDSQKAFKNLEALLPRFLAHFSEKGFTFEAL